MEDVLRQAPAQVCGEGVEITDHGLRHPPCGQRQRRAPVRRHDSRGQRCGLLDIANGRVPAADERYRCRIVNNGGDHVLFVPFSKPITLSP